MPAPKREKLLDEAEALFSKEGFKGVSVDRLLKQAGVAKMTLYKGFQSKEALIRETLHRRAKRLADELEKGVQAAGENPEKRLLSCFDVMEQWANQPEFNGCYFINAIGEYGVEDREEAKIARDYKAAFLSRLEGLCNECGVDDANRLARDLFILLDGATMSRLTLQDREAFSRAKAIARHLLMQAQTN